MQSFRLNGCGLGRRWSIGRSGHYVHTATLLEFNIQVKVCAGAGGGGIAFLELLGTLERAVETAANPVEAFGNREFVAQFADLFAKHREVVKLAFQFGLLGLEP